MGKVSRCLLTIIAASTMVGASGAWAKGGHRARRAPTHRSTARKSRSGAKADKTAKDPSAKKEGNTEF